METGLVDPALSRLRALFPASVSVNPCVMKRRLGACRAAVSGFVSLTVYFEVICLRLKSFLLCLLLFGCLIFVVQVPSLAAGNEVTVGAKLEAVEDFDKSSICGMVQHEHVSGVCYDTDGNLVCAREAHVHDDTCFDQQADIVAPNIVLAMPSVGGSGVVWIYAAGIVVFLLGVGIFAFRGVKRNKK